MVLASILMLLCASAFMSADSVHRYLYLCMCIISMVGLIGTLSNSKQCMAAFLCLLVLLLIYESLFSIIMCIEQQSYFNFDTVMTMCMAFGIRETKQCMDVCRVPTTLHRSGSRKYTNHNTYLLPI